MKKSGIKSPDFEEKVLMIKLKLRIESEVEIKTSEESRLPT